MNKSILFIIIAIASSILTANAQEFYQGNKTIAANVSDFSLRLLKPDDSDTQTYLNLGIKGNYFVADNLALTLGGFYGYNNRDNSLKGEIGGRYYVWEYIYGGLSYIGEYNFRKINSSGKAEIGATYYISDNAFIESAIFFEMGARRISLEKEQNFINSGLSISFGVNF
ncbi:MAG: hypothetical protein LBH32_00580 [Dysgonamonadaceae bacterium]|jgi:hypothetical protein|nr:hypothetical protein [Dysgonamonadaceae bacterium]